ncbi:uncharacterized protein LOC131002792 [Salvia miltiorrhiza]|uniref:uncharacterized protein LOC131002792 n=1 Tax=Salvia miltiorrhiza TaxID=226208 RepID=UPI0025ABC99A|nr:uncharacterized protein LOC131002792 [Salvia miltiorrhiza]
MEKTVAENPKGAKNKHAKRENSKKQLPLKVVYITNPIKFTATASEFRALVQELTGQDADVSDSSRFAAADGGASKAASAEVNAHAAEESAPAQQCEDTSEMMIDNFEGLAAFDMWHVDYDAL